MGRANCWVFGWISDAEVREGFRVFGELSDGYVLKTEYEASLRDDNSAKAKFRTALDRGIPIIADGLTRLFNGIRRHKADVKRKC
ncbi:Uncharacterised protein [uncultured archaeon]|nr:Uncharacterised protein [uncultured archaeon]